MKYASYMLGMDYGIGIDSMNGLPRGEGTARTTPQGVANGDGQSVHFMIERIETTEDLLRTLHVDAEVDASYGLGSGSARFSFAQQCKVHEYSLYLAASVAVTNGAQQMRDVKLAPAGWELLKNGKGDRFYEQFGDQFVAGLVTGGYFVALLEIITRDERHKSEVSAALEASYGTPISGVDFSAQFGSTVQRAASKAELRVQCYQEGGADTTMPTTPDGVIAKATGFAPNVDRRPVPYVAMLQDYRALDLPDGPNFVDLRNAKDVLRNLMAVRSELVERINQVDYIVMHPEQFEAFDGAAMKDFSRKLRDAANAVTHAASTCANSVAECRFIDMDVPAFALPKRKAGGGEAPRIDAPVIDWRRVRDMAKLRQMKVVADGGAKPHPTLAAVARRFN